MGKRKERRLAAMSTANRRVKLDLFAEPPGEEMGKHYVKDVGGDQEQDQSASVPSSPSSSGQNQENPLLLLGQYSDDILDDTGSKEQQKVDVTNNSQVPDDKEKEHVDDIEHLGGTNDEVIEGICLNLESNQANSPKDLKPSDVEYLEKTAADIEHCESELLGNTCVSELSENDANGHVIGHWKLVLHEESNQYYYWNTVTGETSWVVPESFVVGTQTADEQSGSAATIEERAANAVEAHAFTNTNMDTKLYCQLSADGPENSNLLSKDNTAYTSMEFKGEKIYDSSQNAGQHITDNGIALYGNFTGYSSLSENLASPSGVQHAYIFKEEDVRLLRESDHHASEDTHALQLVKYGEVLLQRLDMLYRSMQQPEKYDGIRREIEIRISDCRALSSYGLSLLPFWWHTDVHLKHIESKISKGEALMAVQPEDFSDLTAKLKDPQSGAYLEVAEKDDKLIVISESGTNMANNENGSIERVLLKTDFDVQGPENRLEMVSEEKIIPSSASVPTLIYNAEEDMDVDMEVDETPPSPSSEQNSQLNLISSQHISLPSDDYIVPPPPEEEWVPPPPPEVEEPYPPPPPPQSELIMPENEMNPPPEDASTSFQPSYIDTISYSLPNHYSVGYPIPTCDYYPSTVNEISNETYYGITGASQLTESEPPAYYEAAASSNLTDAVLNFTPVVPAAYYDVANASISSGPVFINTEHSAFYVESSAVNYKDTAPAVSHFSVVELPVDSLVNTIPKISKDSQLSTVKALPSLPTAQTVGASSGNGIKLDTQPPAAPNNQPKARSKKRVAVATLRSNKKVSTLVDKWKAAKEELHGNVEEEPENVLEILEKKRQKEIEAWRARQVATGEAQDNANFVPLGSDWRERVKRKRTDESSTEDCQPSSTSVAVKDRNQPDLVELSKGLPSGWQVYWDDSTKQVYYGNHSTSETTWTRPTSSDAT